MPPDRRRMQPEHEQRILKNIVKLRAADPADLMYYFIEEELWEMSDIECINGYNPNTKANRWKGFQDLLFNCGPRAYDTFLQALKEKGYKELATIIEPTQLEPVDVENSTESQRSLVAQKNERIRHPENELERVNSQNSARTLAENSSKEGGILSRSQLKNSSQSDVGNQNCCANSQSYQIIPLNQALDKELDETVTVKVMQVEMIELSTEPKFRMGIIVADQSKACRLILYNEKYQERMSSQNHSLLITNAINKQTHLVASSKTVISMGQKFKIPQTVLDTVKDRYITVKEAMTSPEGMLVSVKGKVSKIKRPLCMTSVNNRLVPLIVVSIKDSTAHASLEIWGHMAENIQKGHVLAMKDIRVKLFENEKRFMNTHTSKFKIISNEQLSQLSDEGDEEENLKTGKIDGLIEVEPYSSCPLWTCRNKRLRTTEVYGMLMCPKHGRLVSSETANMSVYARFHVEVHGRIHTLVAFKPILELLFEAKGEEFNLTFNKQSLERDIMNILPYVLHFFDRKGVIESVRLKRKNPW